MTRNGNDVILSLTEARVISQLLDIAGDVFTNHGCTDLPDRFYEGMPESELLELSAALRKVNKSDKDPDETDQDFLNMAMQDDSIMMSLMSGYLEKVST